MAWSITLNGTTYTDADFANYGYITKLPAMLADAVAAFTAYVSAALGHATAAAQSAATALNAPGTQATSATSFTLGTGSKTFTLAQAGKAFPLGGSVAIARTSDPTKVCYGTITAFADPALTVNVTKADVAGGPFADWTISISGVPGSSGANGIGTGGAAISGSVTLTASSAGAMIVTPTAPGQYMTLPDAQTCVKGAVLFAAYNAGPYDYGVKDASGNQLGWIPPMTGGSVGLSDNASAAGVWLRKGLSKIGITAEYKNSALSGMNTAVQRIAMDANRTMLLFGNGSCNAIIYDQSTQTWGAPAVVRTPVGSSSAYIGTKTAADQVLVLSCDSTTALEAVTLTCAGTGITVNSGQKATATLAGTFNNFVQLVQTSQGWSFSYCLQAGSSSFRCVTISGTTPTIGAQVQLIAANQPTWIFGDPASAILRTVFWNGTNTLTCKPYTITGASAAAGTPATTATDPTGPVRVFKNGNGNIVAIYQNASAIYGAVSKLTATTEAISTANLLGMTIGIVDCITVSASKTLVCGSAGTTSVYINILTDSAGAASAGTATTESLANAPSYVVAAYASATSARVIASNAPCTRLAHITVDVSGASPAVTKGVQVVVSTSSQNPVYAADQYGVRDRRTLVAGTTVVNVCPPSKANSAIFSGAGDVILTERALPVVDIGGGTSGAANEGWFMSTVDGTSAGVVFQRVEAAA